MICSALAPTSASHPPIVIRSIRNAEASSSSTTISRATLEAAFFRFGCSIATSGSAIVPRPYNLPAARALVGSGLRPDEPIEDRDRILAVDRDLLRRAGPPNPKSVARRGEKALDVLRSIAEGGSHRVAMATGLAFVRHVRVLASRKVTLAGVGGERSRYFAAVATPARTVRRGDARLSGDLVIAQSLRH